MRKFLTATIMICLIVSTSVNAQYYIGTMNTTGLDRQPICEYDGPMSMPHWSPDMTKVTFYSSSSSTGRGEIFTYDLLAEVNCQLTAYGNFYGQSYPRFYNDTTIWHSYTAQAGFSEMAYIVFDGCTVLDTGLFTDFHSISKQTGSFDLSENYIVFYVQNASAASTGELYIAPLTDLADTTRLTNDGTRDDRADINPAETKIVYLKDDGVGTSFNVHVMDINGDNKTKLTFLTGSSNANQNDAPMWSEDGLKIYYSYYDGSQWDIYELNPADSTTVNITNTLDENERASEFRDGKILYSTDKSATSLYLTPMVLQACDSDFVEQPVTSDNWELLKGGNFAFKIPDGIRDLEVSFTGYLTESWGFNGYEVNYDSGFVIIYVTGGDIPIGDNELFGLRFKVERECRTNSIITWDTALSDDPVRKTFVVLEDFEKAYPIIDSINNFAEILGYEPGDVTDDGFVDLADITKMIDHVYISKDPLCIRNAGLLNSDGLIDLADISRLIDHIYISKTPLECDYGIAPPYAKISKNIGVYSSYCNGQTSISIITPDDLRGLHVELIGDAGATPISFEPERLDVVFGRDDKTISIGVLDLDGSELIRAGESTILTLQGEYEIVTAQVVTENFVTKEILINAKTIDALPDDFALYQNYPNPFNPTTTIQFDMPVASTYEMTIYNIAGQVVETQNGHSEAGTVQFEWDASDKASGVYFYRLQVGDLVETKKMVLLK